MNIKTVLESAFKLDFKSMTCLVNPAASAIWMTDENSGLKIHFKNGTNGTLIRIYKFADLGNFESDNIRITLTEDSLILTTISEKFPEIETRIDNYHELLSEEAFFQQSLVQDFGYVEHKHIVGLINLFINVIDYNKDTVTCQNTQNMQ